MIFYDKSCLYKNKGLTEIKDKGFVNHLKKEFEDNYKHFGCYKTPIICGTIVSNDYKCKHIFERKLKMLKAPIYALLQIC